MRYLSQWLRLPAACILCGVYHKNQEAVCNLCASLLSPINFACNCCRLPLPDNTFLLCGNCIKQPPSFDTVLCNYYFDDIFRYLLHKYKYEKALFLRYFFVKKMLEALPSNYSSQCLVPIPLHPLRLRERGFNQAVELAKLLALSINKPVNLNLCSKNKFTHSQTKLNRKERIQNLKNTFTTKPTSFEHITLIDDLVTTGATAQAIANEFKKQGVKRVDIWCIARTPINA